MMLSDEIAYERKTIPQAWPESEKAELMRLRLVEGRDWSEIAVILKRSEAAVKSKFKYEQCQPQNLKAAIGGREPVPASVLAEQTRRIAAWSQRTLTAAAMGDPPPGFSALGGEGSCVSEPIEIRAAQDGDRPSLHGKMLGKALALIAEIGRRDAPMPIPDTCLTCAFREGTMPNQTAGTGMVALNCVLRIDTDRFACHHGPERRPAATALRGIYCRDAGPVL
jgi:hypothetical protein